MRLQNVLKNSVFEASKLVSTNNTLLLKHYHRHQGYHRSMPKEMLRVEPLSGKVVLPNDDQSEQVVGLPQRGAQWFRVN